MKAVSAAVVERRQRLFQVDTKEKISAATKQAAVWSLKHASESLRGRDQKLLLEVIQRAWWAAEFVASPLCDDPQFWSAVLKKKPKDGWMAFGNYAPEAMRADKELLLLAMKADPMALRYAAPSLAQDRDLVLELVAEDWRALRSACEEMKADREIVLTACSQDLGALQFAAPSLAQDPELLIEATEYNGRAVFFLPENKRLDPDLTLEAVRRNAVALTYAVPELRSDRDLVNEAMRTTLGRCSGLLWKEREKKEDLDMTFAAAPLPS